MHPLACDGDMKRLLICIFILISFGLAAQDIRTAQKFFQDLSDRYAGFNTYQADVAISIGAQNMAGEMTFKSPSHVRIDFSSPAEQVLVSDGRVLKIYIPAYSTLLTQRLNNDTTGDDGAAGVSIATAKGLALMQERYFIAYLEGPNAVSLDENSREKVIKLNLTWKSTTEGFRSMIISVIPNGYIRRIEAETVQKESVVFDFTNVKINEPVADNVFDYEEPASASIYSDFITEE